jgi:hypothetical protein
MNNPGHISESLETIFLVKILEFFDAEPGSGIGKIRIMDGKIRIRDPGLSRIRNTTFKKTVILIVFGLILIVKLAVFF